VRPTVSCKTCGVPKSEADFYFHSPGVLANECKECKKTRNARHKVQKRYGMTLEEWTAFRARGCAICGCTHKIGVDHDHVTGEVRDALCERCNLGLGFFGESIEALARAIEYLARHSRAEEQEQWRF